MTASPMAVFRITSRTRRTELAKRSLRYIIHRRSKEQEPITRTLYDQFGETRKLHAYEAMDRVGKRTTFFRTVISPDPATEDTNRDLDLRLLTEATMQRLQLRLQGKPFQYFAAIHTDHSKNRHIHVIVLLEKGRLSKADLKALRQAATGNAREQRRLLDQTKEETQTQELGQPTATAQVIFRSQTARASKQLWQEPTIEMGGGEAPQNPTCASCGPHAQMHRLTKTLFHCPLCGRIVKDAGLRMEVVREPSLELSLGLEVGAT